MRKDSIYLSNVLRTVTVRNISSMKSSVLQEKIIMWKERLTTLLRHNVHHLWLKFKYRVAVSSPLLNNCLPHNSKYFGRKSLVHPLIYYVIFIIIIIIIYYYLHLIHWYYFFSNFQKWLYITYLLLLNFLIVPWFLLLNNRKSLFLPCFP